MPGGLIVSTSRPSMPSAQSMTQQDAEQEGQQAAYERMQVSCSVLFNPCGFCCTCCGDIITSDQAWHPPPPW